MSDAKDPFGFGKYVPGFDFLQNLAKGTPAAAPAQGIPGMPPGLSSWVAPTLSVEELDRRIEELKAVQFWLEQNATALKATLQALEVQKMTLATLQGMNFQMNDVADAFKARTASDFNQRAQEYSRTAGEFFASYQKAAAQPTAEDVEPEAAEPAHRKGNYADSFSSAPKKAAASPARKAAAKKPASSAAAPDAAAPGLVDPMQWWGALTQQFQQIATSAMSEVAQNAAAHGAAAKAPKAQKPMKKPVKKPAASRKTAPRRSGRAGA